MQITWKGSQQEAFELRNAIALNCACQVNECGTVISTCAAHQMLEKDQRALDGLLYVRHTAEDLLCREFDPKCFGGKAAA